MSDPKRNEAPENSDIGIMLLDKPYRIKCPKESVTHLQEAALYLNRKMRDVRDAGKIVGIERVAIITALNIVHDLLAQKKQKTQYIDTLNQQIRTIQSKIESALAESEPA